TFEFEIEQAGMYDVFIDFSHVYNGIPFAALPMQLSFSGAQSNQIDIDLPIIEDGEQAGDCAGDYCDLQAKAGSVQLQAGQYKVALSQDFDHEFLPNVIRAGVTIKKVQ